MEASYSSDETRIFHSDIAYVLDIVKYIDHIYGERSGETVRYLKKLRIILDRFNKKYPGIHVVLSNSPLRLYLKFFVRNLSMDEVFVEFDTDKTLRNKIFGNDVKLDVPFSSDSEKTYPHLIEDTLALKKNPNWDMVEVIYRTDSLSNTNCPEFRILAKYALPDHQKDIKIRKDEDEVFCFGFDTSNEDSAGLVYSPVDHPGDLNY